MEMDAAPPGVRRRVRALLFLILIGQPAVTADQTRFTERVEMQFKTDQRRRSVFILGELQLVFIDRKHA